MDQTRIIIILLSLMTLLSVYLNTRSARIEMFTASIKLGPNVVEISDWDIARIMNGVIKVNDGEFDRRDATEITKHIYGYGSDMLMGNSNTDSAVMVELKSKVKKWYQTRDEEGTAVVSDAQLFDKINDDRNQIPKLAAMLIDFINLKQLSKNEFFKFAVELFKLMTQIQKKHERRPNYASGRGSTQYRNNIKGKKSVVTNNDVGDVVHEPDEFEMDM